MQKKSIKLIRNIAFSLIAFILLISILVSTNIAKSIDDAETVNDVIDCTRNSSWYDFDPSDVVNKKIVSGRDISFSKAGGYCVDPHQRAYKGTYKVVNVIDVNNNTSGNSIRVYGINKNGKTTNKEYSFSNENVKPILMLAYLAKTGNNETSVSTDPAVYMKNSYKAAMPGVFLKETYLKQMIKVGLSDYLIPSTYSAYDEGAWEKLAEAQKEATKLAKQGSKETAAMSDKTDKDNVSSFTSDDGKFFIGPYKLGLTGECKIGEIKINGSIDAVGISTDGKSVEDFDKVVDEKEFYIVLDKEIDDIKSIKITAKESISSVKARLLMVSGGLSQNFFIYRAEDKPQKPSIDLEVPKFGKLEIKKTDQFKDADVSLKDIGFVVWSESKKAYINVNNGKISYVDFETAKKDENEFKTDKNGVVPTIDNLPLGKYKIYETSIPSQLQDYYELKEITLPDKNGKEVKANAKVVTIKNDAGKTQSYVQVKSGQTATVTAINYRDFNTLILKKIEEDTGVPLNGIEFKLYSLIEGKKGWVQVDSENRVTGVTDDFEQASPFVTVNNGVTPKIYRVPLGKYAVYETDLGEYEDIYQELEPIRMEGGNTGGKGLFKGNITVEANKENEFSVTVDNKQVYTSLILKKIDEDTGLPLSGIEFKLYSKVEGKIGWVQVDSQNKVTGVTGKFEEGSKFVTGADGLTPKITKIPLGEYDVYETGLGEYEDIYQELEPIIIDGSDTGGKGLFKGTITVEPNEEHEFTATAKNKQVYISISGNVWEEVAVGKDQKTTNGLLDSNDNMINGIEVKLMDKTTNQAIQTTKTSNGGKYKFEKVKIEELENYYIEFTYDGVTYQSVITPNADSTTQITDENTSKASETAEARKELNNAFTELTGEGQKLHYKKDITLTYSKEKDGDNTVVTSNNICDRNKGINASQRIVNLSKLGDFTIEGDTTSDYLSSKYKELKASNEKEIIREIKNVNLGLYVREQPNLALVKDVSTANVSINGKTYVYSYEKRLDQDAIPTAVGVVFERKNPIDESLKYKMPVYRADAAYENEDKSKELQVSITYKVGLVNNSKSLYGKVNALNEYYSKELEFTKMYTLENNKEQVLSNKANESTSGNYKSAKFDNLNIQVEPQTTQYIYIQFKLPKEGFYNMASKELDTTKDFRNYAEIASYTIYSDKFDSLYAGFDTNSIPNNLDINKEAETMEDDSDKAPGLQVVDAGERTLNGMVFEDSDKDKNDQQRIGDGKYADGENRIANVKVRLLDSNGTEVKVYNSEKKEFIDQSSKSNENGEYTISGFIPGDYTVQYTWGEGEGTVVKNGKDTAITVDSYKSTIWTDESKKEKESKTWYLQNDPRYSDALDNYDIRLELDKNNADLLNVLSQQVSDVNGVSNKATMKSDTKGIEVGIELKDYEEVLVNDAPVYKFNIKNIDLGLIERPRQNMEISKSVESLRLVTDANQVILEAKVNDEGKLEVQAGSVTGGPSYGYIRGETDSDLIDSGTSAIVGYKITVKNTSEKDYASKDYYLYGKVDESKAIALKATAIYDYLKGLNADVEANINWKVLEHESDETKVPTVSEKTATMIAQNDSSSSWYSYSYKNDKGETVNGVVKEVAGSETKETLKEYVEEMQESTEVTFKNLITENRVVSKFEENGKPEIELKAGEEKVIKFSGKQLLSTTNDIRFDNDVEIENVIRKGETGRSVIVEYSKFYNKSEWITITPPTGEDKDYTAIIIISVAAVAILGAGIVFIKKKVLK